MVPGHARPRNAAAAAAAAKACESTLSRQMCVCRSAKSDDQICVFLCVFASFSPKNERDRAKKVPRSPAHSAYHALPPSAHGYRLKKPIDNAGDTIRSNGPTYPSVSQHVWYRPRHPTMLECAHACDPIQGIVRDLDSYLEACVPRPAIQSALRMKLASVGISRCQEGWAREETAELDVSATVIRPKPNLTAPNVCTTLCNGCHSSRPTT